MAAYQAPPSMRFSRQEYWSGMPLPSLFRHIPTRIWNIHPYKNLYTNVHIIALFIISKKWKQSKWLSTDEWINKMWYMSTQWKIKLFSYRKEWNSDTCYDMDEPWKHYAKWMKPVTKEFMLCLRPYHPECARSLLISEEFMLYDSIYPIYCITLFSE